MIHDTHIALFLMGELVAALRANDSDAFRGLAVWGLEGHLKHFWTVDLQVRLDVTRRLVKSLAALAIPDSLRRQRWIPTSSRGQYTDRRRDGLNQHAERNHQQRQACAGSVDVGLEPRFVWHAGKFQSVN